MRVAIFVSVLACLAGTILAKGYGYGGGGGGGSVYGYDKGYNNGGYSGGGYGGYGGGGYGGYGGGGYGGYGGEGYGGYGGGGYSGYGDGKGKGIHIPGRTYSYTRYSVFRDPKLAYYIPYPMPLPPQRYRYIPAPPNDTSLLWLFGLLLIPFLFTNTTTG